ncbi:MAG TPA: two-component regulator propeller domain-containing protein, partial [Blastocatellia bacterium]
MFSFCVLILFGASAVAAGQYRLDVFDTSKGLPQNSVTGLVMTHDGYIWVTTNDGLARFDGVRFTVFNRGNTPQLSTNRLSGAFEDKSGRLWVLGEDGSVVFRKDGEFTVASEPNAILPVLRSPLFDNFAGGVIFHSNHKNYQYVDGRFVPLDIPGLPDDSVIMLSDPGGGLWFTKDTRVYLVKEGKVTTFDLSQYARSPYRAAYQDHYGNVWLSFTDQSPANLLRIRNGRVQSFDFPAQYAWRFIEDVTGDLWFMDYNRGTVYRIGQEALASAEPLLEDITPVVTIEGAKSVTSGWLCPDREGGMWFGTDKGLVRMQPQTIRVFSKSDGLPDENVYPIYQDHASNIWAGIWPNTLARYQGGKFQAFLRTKDTFYIASLFEDNTDRFWYGGVGTLHYLQDGKPIDFTSHLGCGDAEVAAITQDRNGSLWFGTSHGLIRYA